MGHIHDQEARHSLAVQRMSQQSGETFVTFLSSGGNSVPMKLKDPGLALWYAAFQKKFERASLQIQLSLSHHCLSASGIFYKKI